MGIIESIAPKSLLASKELQEDRLRICQGCDHFRQKTGTCGRPVIGNWIEVTEEDIRFTNHNGFDDVSDPELIGTRVKLCGCIMEEKSVLKKSSCPLKLWSEEEISMNALKELEHFVETMASIRARRPLSSSEQTDLFRKESENVPFKKDKPKEPSGCMDCVDQAIKNLREVIAGMKNV